MYQGDRRYTFQNDYSRGNQKKQSDEVKAKIIIPILNGNGSSSVVEKK